MRRPSLRSAFVSPLFSLTLAALGIALPSVAHALPSVLICYADPSANAATQIATAINQGNIFAKVDTMDCAKMTPSLQQLKMYDGVLLWDDLQYLDKNALGNNLADYVDAGGGVVQGMFNFYKSFGQGWDLQGRWATDGYNCITPMDQKSGTLKAQPNDPNSPLVKGVMSFNSQNVGTGGLAMGNNAVSVWDYDINQPAIAMCKPKGHLRVDINFYPNPSNWKGDGFVILKNALVTVAGGLSPIKGLPSPAMLPDTGTGATSAPVTITFTNGSMVAQTATSIGVTGPNASEFGIAMQPQFPITLQPNQSFTVGVNFSPATMGSRTAKLSVSIQGMNVPPSEVTLVGTGIGAKLLITPNPVNVGGTQIGMSVSTTITVANNGGGKITISDMQLGNPAFAITAGPDLPVAISGGGSFPLTITFTPTMNGLSKDTLVITTNDPNAPTISVPLSGFAGPPAIATDAGSVAFGAVNVNAKSMPQTITIQNVGFSDLVISNVALSGMNVGDFQLGAKMTPFTIAAQSSQTVAVTFAPQMVGTRIAQLVISSNDVNAPTKTVNLFGTGTMASITVAPMMLDLGTARVGSGSGPGDVTITTTGNGTVHIVALTFSGANPGTFSQSAGPGPNAAIAPNTTAKLSFICKPTSIGLATASLNVVTDVGAAMVGVKCLGTSPKITVTPNLIDFGVIAVNVMSAKQKVSIANTGTDDLNVSNISIGGQDQADFVSTDLPMAFPVVVKPGKTLDFTVVFTPTSPVQEIAEIDFATDDPLLPMGHINMTGLGAQAGLSISPQSVDAGMVLAGTSSQPIPVVITNSGAIPLTLTAVKIAGPGAGLFRLDRQIDAQNTVSLPPKQSITVNVTFSPLGPGGASASLQVSAMGLGGATSIMLKGTGITPNLQVGLPGGATLLDFGDVAVGMKSMPLSVGLRNAGTAPVTVGSITLDKAGAFAIDMSKTTLTIQPGATTSFDVTFAPSAMGAAQASVSVRLKDATSAVAVIGAKGNGTAGANTGAGGCSVAGRGRGVSQFGATLFGLLSTCGLALVLRRRRRLTRRVLVQNP